MKPQTQFPYFEALDIRIGRILEVQDAQTKKPTYKMKIDFGSQIGVKVSCGAYRNYSRDELVGKQVVAVVNFQPLKMGPEISEALVLGVKNDVGETIYLTPQSSVPIGGQIF